MNPLITIRATDQRAQKNPAKAGQVLLLELVTD
jgi:hypothetical protein